MEKRNYHNIQIEMLKAVIPFFDVAPGEPVDLESILQAAMPFLPKESQKGVQMVLSFFQMRRMMDLVKVLQQTNDAGEADGMDMMSMIMGMMGNDMPQPEQQAEGEENSESEHI